MADERERRIRARAHRIWEEEGRPDGKDKEHWDLAESEEAAGDSNNDGANERGKPDILKIASPRR